MLTLWRRHTKDCPHYDKDSKKAAAGFGRSYTKCVCPIWCDGTFGGRRRRESLDTRDWARAGRKLAALEDPSYGLRSCAQPGCFEMVDGGRCKRHLRTVKAAVVAFHDAHQDVAESTKRNYKRELRLLEDFIAVRGISSIDQIDLATLNAFRTSRVISARTWVKELSTIRSFFRYCFDNEWIFRNWADKVQMPKNLKPAEREPYQPAEVARIIAACDQIGRASYERLRARAMVLLLRYTALRISDVSTLERDRVRDGEIFVRTTKNGKLVRLPVPGDLQTALDVLPAPRGAEGKECPYFFWSGRGTRETMHREATRTLGVVFEASGVQGACSHRFRHTLATEVLDLGGTFEEAADILGDTATVIRKHYAKWSSGRQARITDLLARIWHAKKPPTQPIDFKDDTLVRRVGLEKTDNSKIQ